MLVLHCNIVVAYPKTKLHVTKPELNQVNLSWKYFDVIKHYTEMFTQANINSNQNKKEFIRIKISVTLIVVYLL